MTELAKNLMIATCSIALVLMAVLYIAACTSVTVIGTDNAISISNKPIIDANKGVDDTTEDKQK
jgi:hypothetical protein